jgi:hypothetical protein
MPRATRQSRFFAAAALWIAATSVAAAQPVFGVAVDQDLYYPGDQLRLSVSAVNPGGGRTR